MVNCLYRWYLARTPSQWLDIEEEQTDLWQPVYDVFSSIYFNYKQWRYQQQFATKQSDDKVVLLSIAAILLLVLIWRLIISRNQLLKLQTKTDEGPDYFDLPGKDSELYLIEQALSGTGNARLANESMTDWAKRINNRELLVISKMHYQYRFDNSLFSDVDRQKLKQEVQQWLREFT